MDSKKKRSKNIIIKIVSLLCSFGLWLYIYNVDNPTIDNKVTGVTVKINNLETLENSKLALIPDQEFKVTITIEGSATDVYLAKSDSFKLAVDLSSYALRKGENYIPVEVVDAPKNINIKNPEALRVKVMLDEQIQKSFSITEDIKKSASNGVVIGKVVLNPINASVTGPSQYVNRVKSVVARDEAKAMEKDISMKVPLIALDEAGREVKDIKITPAAVEVAIQVRRAKTVGINVVTKGNINKNLLLKSLESIPSKIEITGDEIELNKITSIDTEPIDLALISSSKDIAVKLVVPKNITLLNNGNGMINVKVNIESINQKEFMVPVSIKGLGNDLKTTLSNEKVTIVLQGDKDLIDNMKIEEIQCELDLTNQAVGEYTLSPKVSVKNGASIISVNPEKVKVVIAKK